MRFLCLCAGFALSFAAHANTNSIDYPEWVINTPTAHASYCSPIIDSIDNALKAATVMAGIDLGNSIERTETTGKEVIKTTGQVEKYHQQIEVISTGYAPTVKVVSEKVVNGELCVLVTQN